MNCFPLEIERPPPRLEYPLTGVRKSLGGKGPRSAVFEGLYFLEERGRDIGGGTEAIESGKSYEHSLLTTGPDDTTTNTFELTTDNLDLIVGFVMEVASLEHQQILVVSAGGTDKVEHLVLRDSKRRVAPVLTLNKMIIVEAEELRQLRCRRRLIGIVITNEHHSLPGSEIGEHDIGNEALQYLFGASLNLDISITFGNVGINTTLDKQLLG